MTRGLALAATMLAVTFAAAPAQASTATYADGVVTVTAAPGERNDLWIYGSLDNAKQIGDEAGITPGTGCRAISPTLLECAPVEEDGWTTYGNYSKLVADLGDGDDTFTTTYLGLEVTVAGGDGNDVLDGGFADAADIDGGAGDDKVEGTRRDDRLHGGAGNDTVNGDDGSDVIDGGDGVDSILGDGGLGGSNGNDRITSRDGSADSVSCDLGADAVTADAFDVVEEATCESIDRGPSTTPGPGAGGGPAGGGAAAPSVPASVKAGALAKRGLKLRGSSAVPGTVEAKLTVSKGAAKKLGLKGRTLGRAVKAFAAGEWTLTVKLPKAARSRLKGAKPVRVTVTGSVKTGTSSAPFKRTVRVR